VKAMSQERQVRSCDVLYRLIPLWPLALPQQPQSTKMVQDACRR
jgi:hypothetical protein